MGLLSHHRKHQTMTNSLHGHDYNTVLGFSPLQCCIALPEHRLYVYSGTDAVLKVFKGVQPTQSPAAGTGMSPDQQSPFLNIQSIIIKVKYHYQSSLTAHYQDERLYKEA